MNAIARYEEQSITTQNRGRLVVLLYEGAIRFLRQAMASLEAGDPQGKNHSITRAQDILLGTEFGVEYGGRRTDRPESSFTVHFFMAASEPGIGQKQSPGDPGSHRDSQ